MIRESETASQKAWDYIWNRIYCEKTSLFYDFLVSDEADANICHLPTPELIACQIPNPCGYGTGMEDSALNGGMMLDTVLSRYTVNGEESMRIYADKIFNGLKLCAMVSERAGFVARSVSPVDGKSHYSNTSRDQYTHWVYSMYNYYISPLCTDTQRADIQKLMVEIAERMETDVTPENGWNLLRDDGRSGIVCQMWGDIGKHEYLRLPMFYAAAYKVSGDAHWNKMYLQYRDEAMDKTFSIDFSSYSSVYPILQMQYSLRLLYDIDTDEVFRERCIQVMKRGAEFYKTKATDISESFCSTAGESQFSYCYLPWNKAKAEYNGFFGGKAYYNPNQGCLEENMSNYPMRDVGDSGALVALCGGMSDETILKAVERMLRAVDYTRHYSATPINLINAYWLIQKDMKEHLGQN